MAWLTVGALAFSAGSAAYSANQNNKAAKRQANALKGSVVKPPNLLQDARRGWIESYNLAPMVAAQENALRERFAPQQAQLAADIYARFAPQFAKTNMATLRSVDPESIDGRKALYSTVSDELAQGRGMSPETERQITQAARGALAARGNNLGNAAALAEATNYGEAGDRALQNRIANMGNFLRGPTPEDRFGSLMGGGAAALSPLLSSVVSPQNQYIEPPTYWKNQAEYAWKQYGANSQNAQTIGQANAMTAGAANPWMAALAAGAGTYTAGLSSGAIGGGTTAPKAATTYAVPNGAAALPVSGYSYNPRTGYSPA